MAEDQLYEMRDVTQDSEENIRRHFTNTYFDVYVWINRSTEEIISFQLCYDIYYDEKDLIWYKGRGFSHQSVDASWNRTPVLRADGIFNYDKVVKKFKNESKKIDSSIASFIYEKLAEHYSQ